MGESRRFLVVAFLVFLMGKLSLGVEHTPVKTPDPTPHSAQPAFPSPAANRYSLNCEGYRSQWSGSGPAPQVRLEATISLGDYPGHGFLCNEAVTAPADQPRHYVTSQIRLEVQKRGSAEFFPLRAPDDSMFGECQLDPQPGRRGGLISIYGKRFACDAKTPCGHWGAIDPSRSDWQYEYLTLGLPLAFNSQGGLQLAHDPDYLQYANGDLSLFGIPTGGDHYPEEIEFHLTQCQFRPL